MRSCLLVFITLFFSTIASANTDLSCGYLNITVVNNTGHDCVLRNTKIYNRSRVDGDISQVIANGSMAPTFRIQQTYTNGPSIQLDYQCENKTIAITSRQNYCFLSAGDISGTTESSNNVRAQYNTSLGSYWSGLPGQITWKLY